MSLNNPSYSTFSIKNCCRCGDEFQVKGNALVCPTCRKPPSPKSPGLGHHLTLRERQIVFLVSQAKLNKEIAYQLHLSEGTIKEYLNKIFRKLDVRNRTQLAIWSLNNPAACGPASASLEEGYLPAH
jgi:DNA-binding NarL/FixJ family response regulator